MPGDAGLLERELKNGYSPLFCLTLIPFPTTSETAVTTLLRTLRSASLQAGEQAEGQKKKKKKKKKKKSTCKHARQQVRR